MKYTILIAFLLTLSVGCKKEAQDRIIIVYGQSASAEVHYRKFDKGIPSNGEGEARQGLLQDGHMSFTVEGDEEATLDIVSDSANFTCKVTVDGKKVYHHDGKEHHLHF